MQPGITFLAEIPCWTDSMFVFEYTVFDNIGTYIYSATATNASLRFKKHSNKRGSHLKFDRNGYNRLSA